MKQFYLLFVVGILFECTNAGTILASYSGTTTGGPTWAPPDTTTACAAQTTNTGVPLASFNITFPAAGVYQVKCLFEDAYKRNNPLVFVYTGSAFNPTTPCTNFLTRVNNVLGLSGGPVVDDAVYVTGGVNTFIVTAQTSSGSGIFACQVISPQWGGSTTNSNLYIDYMSNGQQSSCSSGSTPVQASIFSWVQANSGQYDVNIYFANASYAQTSTSFGANAALYSGNLTSSFPANRTAIDPCAFNPIKSGQLSAGKFAVLLQNVTLTAATTYTVVLAGGSETATGFWGATVDPSYVHTTSGSLGTWTQPDHSGATSGTCSDGYTNNYIFRFPFIAEHPTYIIDTQQLDYGTYLDTFSFLYAGYNNLTVPSTCAGFLYGGDTGDVRPIAYSGLVPGQPYTVVVSSYSQGSQGDFGLFTFSGVQIGSLPVLPTTGVGSSAVVTGAATSGLPDSGAAELAISALVLIVAAVICF